MNDDTLLTIEVDDNDTVLTDDGLDADVEISFKDSLPEELRERPEFREFKSIKDLAKSYVDLRGKDFDIPEDHKGYELNFHKLVRDEHSERFGRLAHETGLSKKQAGRVAEFYNNIINESEEELETYNAMGIEKLRTEWGRNYEKNIGLAKRVVNRLGSPEFIDMLNDTKLGNNPVMVRMFHKVGEMLSEDVFGGKSAPAKREKSLAEYLYGED